MLGSYWVLHPVLNTGNKNGSVTALSIKGFTVSLGRMTGTFDMWGHNDYIIIVITTSRLGSQKSIAITINICDIVMHAFLDKNTFNNKMSTVISNEDRQSFKVSTTTEM